MKKKLLALCLMLGGILSAPIAQVQKSGFFIHFQVCNDDPTLSSHDIPRSPVQCPTVSIDDHTLYI